MKDQGVTNAGLEALIAAAKKCFCHIQSSLHPELTEGNDPQPEVLSLRWGLYNKGLDQLITASESLLNELRDDVRPPGWDEPKESRRSDAMDDYYSYAAASAPPQLYIAKIDNYPGDRYRLASIRNKVRTKSYTIKQSDQWVDLFGISGWLRHCDSHHSHHCSFFHQSEDKFDALPKRLIDVEQMCLIQVYSRQQCAALSYVWGSGSSFKTLRNNIGSLHISGSLSGSCQGQTSSTGTDMQHDLGDNGICSGDNSSKLPKTLTDAIYLTRRLGIGYLWIDALCIVQDEEKEKREQLSRMESIYANAYFTLVAAGGTAFSGLRGLDEKVTPPMKRRIRKPIKGLWRNPDLLWKQKIRDHQSAISYSAWNSRAWTFQEQMLSRRLLVLNDEIVSWECHCAVWFEGIEALNSQCRDQTKTITRGFAFQLPPDFNDFAKHVRPYNHRKLTFPEDSLRAFERILGILSTAFVGGFVCGISRMFFDRGLSWWIPRNNGEPARRRSPTLSASSTDMPPTWTWAAWYGEIQFLIDDADASPLVEWQYYSRTEDEWSTVVLLEEETRNDRSGNHRETSLAAPNFLGIAEHLRSHLLFARADRAYFRLVALPNGNIGWKNYWGTPVVGTDGIFVGKIKALDWIDSNTPTRAVPCELVAISEAVENQYYNVLWIE